MLMNDDCGGSLKQQVVCETSWYIQLMVVLNALVDDKLEKAFGGGDYLGVYLHCSISAG